MKVLNLYAGIGGNRKLWQDVEVTAVEIRPQIAKIYQDFFPQDKVIIRDAHQYLVEHFNEFDFIWSSPPCPSHSIIRKNGIRDDKHKPIYPSMKLYEEILFLQGYAKCKWVVENVVSWYEPLIKPQEVAMHYFWANFNLAPVLTKSRAHHASLKTISERKGFDLTKYEMRQDQKHLLLRNCVEPEVGLEVFECGIKVKQPTLPINNSSKT